LGILDAQALVVPVEAEVYFKAFWQHSGELISSRFAKYVLDTIKSRGSENQKIAPMLPRMNGSPTHIQLREKIAKIVNNDPTNVFLYPTGMASIFAAFRMVNLLHKERSKAVLVGFPYLDTLKMLRRNEWSDGVHFFPKGETRDLDEIERIANTEELTAIFTEFPCNPLLRSADLERLSNIAHANGTILVVDDTVGSFNINTMMHRSADIVVTSLTKIFSGTGTVMGGSLVLNPNGPMYSQLHQQLSGDQYIFEEDALELCKASQDLEQRIKRVNKTANDIVQRLQTHPLVQNLYYPSLVDKENYQKYVKPIHSDDGTESFCGGPLLSVVLNGGEKVAKVFYDTLGFAKGPSLGTNFTLACPYTILAHFYELDYVESCGVDRNLVRISIGLEDVEDIWSCLSKALDAASSVI